MNFKKPKKQVIDDAVFSAESILVSAFQNMKYGYQGQSPNTTIDQIQYAMLNSIRMAIASLVNDIYTDEEFENDLKIR